MAQLPAGMPSYPLDKSTPRTFTEFPNLPPELRCKIWNYALPGPRVIHIMGTFTVPKKATQCFAETIDHPILLQVSRESRNLALKHYRCTFEPYLRYPVYFDPSRDLLLMQNQHVLNMFFERSKSSMASEVAMVKVIAVDLVHLGHRDRPPPNPPDVIGRYLSVMAVASALKNAVARFGNLRQIILLRPHLTIPAQDVQEIICSEEFHRNLRSHYSKSKDQYALKRKELLKDEDGNVPIISPSTVEDFWNRFS